MKRIKIVFLGDGGVGKTTYLSKAKGKDFETRYVATMGVDVSPVKIGNVQFNCWDTAGQEKFAGLRDGYYVGTEAAIIMFDTTSRVTYKSVYHWYRDLVRVCGDTIPIILCGTKTDCDKYRRVFRSDIKIPELKRLPYFEFSTKNTFTLDPFLYIAKELGCEIKARKQLREVHATKETEETEETETQKEEKATTKIEEEKATSRGCFIS